MSNYKRKLRSGKALPKIEITRKEEIDQDDLSCKDDLKCPKTPPGQSIESYFPPSPYGRKRYQAQGDRFIPNRDRDLIRDFQMLARTHTKNTNETTRTNKSALVASETRRFNAYFRAELLDDLSVVDEYLTDPTSNRQAGRVLHFTSTSSTEKARTHTDNISHTQSNICSTSSSHHTRRSHTSNSAEHIPSSVLSPPSLQPPSRPTPPNNSSRSLISPNSSNFQTSLISEAGRRILLAPPSRHINTTPIKILDAPEILDDFYLNLVDWGINESLAVGLGSCVYLWNANTNQVTKLCDLETDNVTSVNWAHMGSVLAVGTNSGKALLFDAERSKRLRTWRNHDSRVGSIAWKSNILTTGGRDHAIYHHDVRSPDSYFRKLSGHSQEICGLKWNNEGSMLASGGNDNHLVIWNSHERAIKHRFTQHIAAVKAISWSPHKRGLLVSGGGTIDKTIKFWNTTTGSLISSHDTGSQVCNIAWSKKSNDLVSTHGYANNDVNNSNQVIVWRADKMERLATLTGHTSRVLYMSMSKDGNTVVTGAGDESLRFWDIFSTVENARIQRERRSLLR